MSDKKEILKTRIRLLSRGILPPKIEGKFLSNFASIGVGAGPQGRKFYVLSKNDLVPVGMISLPIYPENHYLSGYALKTELGEIPGTLVTEDGILLKSCLPPNYFNKSNEYGKLIPIMLHCYNTATMVLGFKCLHFEECQECKFCEIESVGKNIKKLPELNTSEDIVNALKIAMKSEKIDSLTITSGTYDEPDKVVEYYIEILKKIKKEIDIKIHVQFEPVKDLNLFKELSNFASSIGIFLEIFNEEKREEICPGKFKIKKEEYIKNWEASVKYFKSGNVMTTCILGFGVDYNEILKNIEAFAKIGVRTSLLFLRSKSKKLENFIPDFFKKSEEELIQLHIKAVEIMKKNGIIYEIGKYAGCVGCQGCTAMMEAYNFINN